MEYLTFLDAKRWAKCDMREMKQRKLSVVGDCSTQHLCIALKGVAVQAGIGLSVYEADYNQIDLQLYDSGSPVYAGEPDEILVFMCTEMLYRRFCQSPSNQRVSFAQTEYGKILSYWDAMERNSAANILQTNFMEYDDRSFGNFGAKTEAAFIFQLRKLNYLLMTGAAAHRNINVVDMQYVRAMFADDQLRDPKMYCAAKLPYTLNALPVIAQQVIKIISAHMGRMTKCVIVDLDNTLWGGVVGDDSWDGIQIGDLGSGQAFSAFQQWLKELKQRGILLAVCSKNEETTAKEPFEKNPEMVLHLEDISVFVANWRNKAQNILEIQKILNIGMDSIVFLDDNPFERDAVRQIVDGIIVPELPKDPALYVSYLESLNLFETVSFSEEDALRAGQYRSEMSRIQSQSRFKSFDDYLISLDMTAEAVPFDAYHYPRIAQLSQRSNQFNLRTVRYSEADIARVAGDSRYLTIYFTLKDKFGEYGLISAIILEKRDDITLVVENWFMSCRVLKRGMEEFILNKVVETAAENGFRRIIGEYIPTSKNAMVSRIYSNMGFVATEQENQYLLDTAQYQRLSTHIEEV